MKQKTLDRALASMTPTAKKVYEAVPINEPWEISKIVSEVQRLKHNFPYKIISGCLNTLKQASLLKEPKKGQFIRTRGSQPVKVQVLDPQTPAVVTLPAAAPTKTITIKPKEPAMAKRDPMDIISGLTEKMRSIATSMTELADEFDDVACELSESVTMSQKDADRLKLLKGLLKDIGEE